MKLLLFGLVGTLGFASIASDSKPISTGGLLQEMCDLDRLAMWPQPNYRTVQFSSYDRRSTTSEAPGWFSNSDGFGREPIPGFMKVLREPKEGKNGLYLLAEAEGPGVIVRGWSAGMNGILRVYLDPTAGGEGRLVFEGPAHTFLVKRSVHYLKAAGIDFDAGNAFSQEDADYFPIPFAKGLRVTWEGNLNELHFYHLQVRLYEASTAVETFDAQDGLKQLDATIRSVAAALTRPSTSANGQPSKLEAAIEPGGVWTWSPTESGPGAVRELKLRLKAHPLDPALRGALLRIAFDGAQRPQVEAPLGDFFGSGPGVNPFNGLPMSVDADGTMTCRFVMPYEKTLRVELVNHAATPVRLEGSILLGPWQWNERSLHFRAKWRADHDLLAGVAPCDLPFALVTGKGAFVGCAVMIMNPSGVPTAGGNWWGEGDEKFLVDGELLPSTFGTGSEDYFNYSWSRPGLFAHPYCGQPLDSGPDTSGYVSNHRFQVTDAIPFEKSFTCLMELWTHNRTPGLSYARIAYYYARPGALDDHRALSPSDLRIIPLPKRDFRALGGARGAKSFVVQELEPRLSAGQIETVPFPLATQLQIAQWHGRKGETLKFNLPVEKDGRVSIHLVAVHHPDGATLRASLDGEPLLRDDDAKDFPLRSEYATRVLNVNLKPIQTKAGSHELVLECVEPGLIGLDYLWLRPE